MHVWGVTSYIISLLASSTPNGVRNCTSILRRQAGRQDRSLSSTSRTRTSTPSPAQARSPSPLGKETRSPNIQPLLAALDISIDGIDDLTITDARSSIDELRLLRAAIFNDASDGKLTKKDKTVFWYRENAALRGKRRPRRLC